MDVVDISFKRLLLEITQKLSMPVPRYDLAVDSAGQFSAYVDVDIDRGDTVVETIRSWGSPACVAGPSEEDAARLSINKLREDLGFNVRDINFEDLKFYKNLYNELAEKYNGLLAKYNTLKWDFKFLKECYGKAMDEKERSCAERSEIQQGLERLLDVLIHPGMVVDVPAEGAAQEPSTAQEPSVASE